MQLIPRIGVRPQLSLERILDSYQRDRKKDLLRIDHLASSSRFNDLAVDETKIALFSYALGVDLVTISMYLREASHSFMQVVNRRHDRQDQSIQNSYKSFLHVCIALISGEFKLAEELAGLIEDPPNATYLGARSEVCNYDQQRIAYAVRYLMAGKDEVARQFVDKISFKDPWSFQRQLLTFILEKKPDLFLDVLDKYLVWNARQCKRKNNPDYPDYFICIPGMGLSTIAESRGLITLDDLPQDNVHLPVEMLRMAKEKQAPTE